MKKVEDSYINTSYNETLINYLIDENLPIRKINPDIKIVIDLNIKKYAKFVESVRDNEFYENDVVKIAYWSFRFDIPVPETILTINYIKRNFSKNKID